MKVADLVLDYLKVLVWPAVVVVALLLFRHRLHDLLGRLTSVEAPGGLKAQFAETLAEVQERLDEIQIDSVEPRQPPDGPAPPVEAALLELGANVEQLVRTKLAEMTKISRRVTDSPVTAVAQAYKTLDQFLGGLYRLTMTTVPPAPTRHFFSEWTFLGADAPLVESVVRLKRLARELLRQPESTLDAETAQNYVATVQGVIQTTAALARQRLSELDG